MKIVVAHNRYSSAQPSGENNVVETEMALLAERAGVTVVPFLRDSDEIGSLSITQKALLPLSPVYAPRAQRELARLLTRERPDVLHLHNPYPLLSPWVVRTAHAHGVPVVQTVHNFRHVCAAGVYFRDGGPCRDCLGKRVPLPAVIHACYRDSRLQSAVMATALTVHRGTWRSVDRYLALTPAIADHLRSFGIGGDQIVVKPNCTPDPGLHREAGTGFLYVGRLTVEKGVGVLLDAWRRHAVGAFGVLRVAGDGPLRERVVAAAAERPDVEYVGLLDPEGVRSAMRAAAIVVVPSIWDEVCPMVVVEALANARPVLATNRGGLPFLVGSDLPDPAGWLIEPEVESLTAALPRAAAEAPTRFGSARRRYETTFAPAVVTEQLFHVYQAFAKPE